MKRKDAKPQSSDRKESSLGPVSLLCSIAAILSIAFLIVIGVIEIPESDTFSL